METYKYLSPYLNSAKLNTCEHAEKEIVLSTVLFEVLSTVFASVLLVNCSIAFEMTLRRHFVHLQTNKEAQVNGV